MTEVYDKQISIRIFRKLHARIERIAKREFRGSVTATARAALEEFADRHEAEAAASRRAPRARKTEEAAK